MSLDETPPTADPGDLARADRLHALLVLVLGLVVGVAILALLSDVILLLFAATLIACQLQGASRFLTHRLGLGYGYALALVVLAVFGGIGIAVWLRGPLLVAEIRIVAEQINVQVDAVWHRLGDADWLQSAIERIQDYRKNLGGRVAGMAAGAFTSTLGGLGSVLLILVAALYLAASPQPYVGGIVALLPHGWRTRAREVVRQEASTLRWWFLGQLLDMAVIGAMTFVGLMVLGVKLSFTLALIAALCNFVPYIGALAGSIPAIVVGLSQGPQTAIYVALLFLAVQTIEGNLVAPLIQRRTVDLPPVITLLSQTVLGTLFGPLGLILATPITAATMVLVKLVYVESILGDRPEEPGSSPS